MTNIKAGITGTDVALLLMEVFPEMTVKYCLTTMASNQRPHSNVQLIPTVVDPMATNAVLESVLIYTAKLVNLRYPF